MRACVFPEQIGNHEAMIEDLAMVWGAVVEKGEPIVSRFEGTTFFLGWLKRDSTFGSLPCWGATKDTAKW